LEFDMRPSRGIRPSPALLLTVGAVGLGFWVAYDLLVPPVPRQQFPDVLQSQGPHPFAPTPPAAIEQLVTGRPPPSATVLPRLKPGMTRVDVENLLGPPGSDDISPVATIEGRTTYRMSYELSDLPPPATVRPIHAGRNHLPSPELRIYRSFVALEFDATLPGHPLVHIHYLDPLF
jgi:hypothetical protein